MGDTLFTFSDFEFRHTGGCQNPHDGFLQNLNRHGISLLSFEFSCLLLDHCEGFCSSPSVRFALEWDAGGEDDRPFSSLTVTLLLLMPEASEGS